MTENEFLRRFPNASDSTIAVNVKLRDAEPERNEATALERPAERKEESLARIVVRFVGYRTRPLDPDNFAGSVKDVLDGLRHSQLIPGDEPWRIKLETEQVKVKTKAEQKTEVEITYA